MFRAVVAVVAVVVPSSVHAGQATCSNPGLPVGASASSDLMPGRLTLNLTTALLPIHSEEVLAEAQGPVLYDTRLRVLETRLATEYAVRSWLAVGLALPFRVVDVDVAFRDPTTGDPVAPPSTIHSRTETLRGIGDPSWVVHAAREIAGYRLHARVGTSLPLGRIEDDPHLLGSIGQDHQHIQFGTGSIIPFAAIEAQRSFGSGRARATLAAWALAHVSLYDNAKGFRAGDRISAGLSAATAFGLRSWTFGAALEGHGETAETWQDVVYQDEGNAGRFDLLAGGGATWHAMDHLAVIADAKLPVHSRISGTQLDYGLVVGLGVVATFDLARRPSWRGLDRAVVATAGTAPDLVPVRARITVFDLWAAWCAPCRELDDRLVALARAHPDRLAVRTLDVVDADSDGWKRHLGPGRFDLPHVKVYDAGGALVFERTAPPAELVRAIEALLR